MNNYYIKHSLLLCLAFGSLRQANAQAAGSEETASPAMANTASGGTYTSAGQTLHIGPGTYTLNGVWEIYSKNIYISKDATFSGTGTIKLFAPPVAGGATLIDGNGSTIAITPVIEINNANNVEQTDQPLATELTTAGWADITSNAGVYSSGGVVFNVANGDWVTNTHKLTLTNAASLSGYATDRYVVTNTATGELVKEALSNNFFFPLGNAEGGGPNYAPANMSGVAGTADYHVNVSDYATSTPDEALIEASTDGYVQRTWMVYAGTTGSSAFMSFIHQTGVGIDDPPYSIISSNVTRYDAVGSWVPGANTSETPGAFFDASVPAGYWAQSKGYAIRTAADASIYFTKTASLIILPVSLLGFEAQKQNNNSVLLTWAVANGQDAKSFTVERSPNGRDWIALGTVAATATRQQYSLSDAHPLYGANYYRLACAEANGTITYSAIRIVSFGTKLVVSVYPNPAKSTITITGLLPTNRVEIFAANGKLVLSQISSGSSAQVFNIGSFTAGVYFIKVLQGQQQAAQGKFIKE